MGSRPIAGTARRGSGSDRASRRGSRTSSTHPHTSRRCGASCVCAPPARGAGGAAGRGRAHGRSSADSSDRRNWWCRSAAPIDDLDRFLEASTSSAAGGQRAEHRMLGVVPPGAQPELEPAVGDVVDGQRLFREERRVTKRIAAHQHPEANPFGHRGERGEQRPAWSQGPVGRLGWMKWSQSHRLSKPSASNNRQRSTSVGQGKFWSVTMPKRTLRQYYTVPCNPLGGSVDGQVEHALDGGRGQRSTLRPANRLLELRQARKADQHTRGLPRFLKANRKASS